MVSIYFFCCFLLSTGAAHVLGTGTLPSADPGPAAGPAAGKWQLQKGGSRAVLRNYFALTCSFTNEETKAVMERDIYLFINSAMIYWASLQGPQLGAGENQEGFLFQNRTYRIYSYKKPLDGGDVRRAGPWALRVLSSSLRLPLWNRNWSDLLSFSSSSVIWGRWHLAYELYEDFMSTQIIITRADAWWPIKQFVDDAFVAGGMIICKQGIAATGII